MTPDSPSDALRLPRRSASQGPAFAGALAMHLALVAALWISVRWHTQPASPAVAVMWTAPDLAQDTPAPVTPSPARVEPEPTPSPIKPDIALKQDKTHKKPPKPVPEPAKPKDQHPKTKAAPAEPAPPIDTSKVRLHNEEIERMRAMSTTGQPGPVPMVGSPGRASSEYEARIRAAVLSNLHFSPPGDIDPKVYAEYEVRLIEATGELNGEPQLTHPSNLPGWDEAVRRAILRTDPFPRQADGRAPRRLTLVFRPSDTH
jgi:colicin import membrane protein